MQLSWKEIFDVIQVFFAITFDVIVTSSICQRDNDKLRGAEFNNVEGGGFFFQLLRTGTDDSFYMRTWSILLT